MSNSIFSLNKGAKLSSANNPHILRKLTAIRVSGYKMSLINQEIEEQHYADLITLIKELGGRILKVNLIDSNGTSRFLEAQGQFNKIVDSLVKAGKFPIVYYAAQLLQFYTIICDTDFKPNLNIKDFQQFLSEKTLSFGSTDSNLFITEYKLILIYNELVSLLKSHADANGQMKTVTEQLDIINFISQQFSNIKQHIDQWVTDAPTHIFLQYLSFIYQYTFAKLIEFQFIIQKEISKESMLELANTQVTHLKLAKKALDNADELYHSFQEIGDEYPPSIEFSLGQTLLSKLPITHSDEMKKHLLTLISLNTETI